MLTGSVAMSCYAEPRMTRDLDIVIECDAVTPTNIVERFQHDCYISPKAVEEAVVEKGMFKVIHLQSIMKADLELLKRQVESMDWGYVTKWANQLNLGPWLEKLEK